MMKKYLNKILGWLEKIADTQQRDFENYILAKNPSTQTDIDYWTKQYLHEMTRRWI